MKAFERATALDSNNASYWSNLGNARRAVGDSAGADKAYRQALETDGKTADAVRPADLPTGGAVTCPACRTEEEIFCAEVERAALAQGLQPLRWPNRFPFDSALRILQRELDRDLGERDEHEVPNPGGPRRTHEIQLAFQVDASYRIATLP